MPTQAASTFQRIPISGPEPFNTLVVVQQLQGMGELSIGGPTVRWPLEFTTAFRLAGFDQRVPPVFRQSTTATISQSLTIDDESFSMRVDEVDGDFDDNGNYVLRANISDDCSGDLWWRIWFSSYVL